MQNSCCPCPSGCIVGEGIDTDAPDDAVRVICSNGGCGQGAWMHAVCSASWEESMAALLRREGRAAEGVWAAATESLRQCGCGRGTLTKDTAYTPASPNHAHKPAQRPRRRTNSRQLQQQPNPARLRGRAASIGSGAISIAVDKGGGPSPPHSFGSEGRRHRPPRHDGPGSEFFSDAQVGLTGSIFARRQSLGSLYAVLPAWKVNGFHIKLEDDCPQGNDDTRIFLLTTLGDHKMREIKCVLCTSEIKVYDKYPLLDGTFFLSPVNHNGEGLPVRHDTRDCFLHAACVGCLESGGGRLRCTRCGCRGWFPGPALLLGSLYSYDILSSTLCCPPLCRGCGRALPLPDPGLLRPFSAASEVSNCRVCGHRDSHYIRRLDSIRLDRPPPPANSASLSPSASSDSSLPSSAPNPLFPSAPNNDILYSLVAA